LILELHGHWAVIAVLPNVLVERVVMKDHATLRSMKQSALVVCSKALAVIAVATRARSAMCAAKMTLNNLV